MTYTSPSWMSRCGSLLISAGIHATIGIALFWSMMAGSPDGSRRTGDRGEVLIVELLPLPDGGAPGTGEEKASLADGAKHQIEKPGDATGRQEAGEAARVGNPPPGDGGMDISSGTEGHADDKVGAPAPSGAEIQAFRTVLLRHIQGFQQYPVVSRQTGEEGLTRIRFIMDRSGRLVEAWIETTSGSRHLDAESLAAIRRAQPLPAPPSNWPQSFEVMLPISFTLH